jgi:type I restriction enzyme M protein
MIVGERQAQEQFFTPRTVIDFIYGMLKQIDPDRSCPRIIDPACCDGGFLRCALDHLITDSSQLYGMDQGPQVSTQWELHRISHLPGLYLHDGLYTDDSISGIRSKSFDWVVGNPLHGEKNFASRLSDPQSTPLIKALKRNYEIWKEDLVPDNDLQLTANELKRLKTFPVEVLFLERFIKLAKSGGRVAIILPDKILASSKMQFARDWVLERAQIHAIVSLPRETFCGTGASTKASIVFMSRIGIELSTEPVMIASVDETGVKDPGLNQLPYLLKRYTWRHRHGND